MPRSDAATGLAAALAVVGITAAGLTVGRGVFFQPDRTVPPPPPLESLLADRLRPLRLAGPPPPTTGIQAGLTPVEWAAAGLAGLLLAVIVVIALWLLVRGLRAVRLARRRAARPAASGVPLVDDEGSDADADEQRRRRLREGLLASDAVVEAEGDPREAVLACYLAMERAVAESGARRAPTETPDELLERVLRDLAVSGEHAGGLTRLFTAVRFGPAPADEAMRRRARHHLDAVRAELAGGRR